MPPLTALVGTRLAVPDGIYAEPVLIRPAPGPVSPPLVAAMPVEPVSTISPYVRGTGGTPFIVSSGLERPMIALPLMPFRPTLSPYEPPPATDQAIVNPNTPVPPQQQKPAAKPGDVMGWWTNAVTGSQVPGKASTPPDKSAGWTWKPSYTVVVAPPKLKPGVEEVPTPLTKALGGFDVSKVPVWGWVAGAALLVLVLRR
jgi:hypothetical protein